MLLICWLVNRNTGRIPCVKMFPPTMPKSSLLAPTLTRNISKLDNTLTPRMSLPSAILSHSIKPFRRYAGLCGSKALHIWPCSNLDLSPLTWISNQFIFGLEYCINQSLAKFTLCKMHGQYALRDGQSVNITPLPIPNGGGGTKRFREIKKL